MLFRRCAEVSAADISAAEAAVLQGCRSSDSIDFIAQWRPRRQAMERNHEDEYERVRAFNAPERDAIALQSPRMNERQWMDAFTRQKANEESQHTAVTCRLTRAFLEEHSME
jgi:hypothetical protein